jgi:hypothetical protein
MLTKPSQMNTYRASPTYPTAPDGEALSICSNCPLIQIQDDSSPCASARKARAYGLFQENDSLEALKSRQELNERLAQRATNDENLDLLFYDCCLLREGLDKISEFSP